MCAFVLRSSAFTTWDIYVFGNCLAVPADCLLQPVAAVPVLLTASTNRAIFEASSCGTCSSRKRCQSLMKSARRIFANEFPLSPVRPTVWSQSADAVACNACSTAFCCLGLGASADTSKSGFSEEAQALSSDRVSKATGVTCGTPSSAWPCLVQSLLPPPSCMPEPSGAEPRTSRGTSCTCTSKAWLPRAAALGAAKLTVFASAHASRPLDCKPSAILASSASVRRVGRFSLATALQFGEDSLVPVTMQRSRKPEGKLAISSFSSLLSSSALLSRSSTFTCSSFLFTSFASSRSSPSLELLLGKSMVWALRAAASDWQRARNSFWHARTCALLLAAL
mmetsp:Transcript_100434/g.199379  ORF Transcript_100434/g.199379 Transcript_100434/m.199379 type:complete len:337 (-) Transcript_100434:701-1711(-)